MSDKYARVMNAFYIVMSRVISCKARPVNTITLRRFLLASFSLICILSLVEAALLRRP